MDCSKLFVYTASQTQHDCVGFVDTKFIFGGPFIMVAKNRSKCVRKKIGRHSCTGWGRHKKEESGNLSFC